MTPIERLNEIAHIIESVDHRAMACDGDVTPTLQEMTQAEMTRIYKLATGKIEGRPKQARKQMNKAGRRTKAWDSAREELKQWCKQNGVFSCEIRWPGCVKDNELGFAHAVKRNRLLKDAAPGTPEHIGTAILVCNRCHAKLERESHASMESIVMRRFNARRLARSYNQISGSAGAQ